MSDVVRIIPLGGLGQIGNNLCVVEQGERRILIDCGLSFPRDEMPGVDLVLPDFAYLREAPGGIDAVSSEVQVDSFATTGRGLIAKIGAGCGPDCMNRPFATIL